MASLVRDKYATARLSRVADNRAPIFDYDCNPPLHATNPVFEIMVVP